MRQLSDGRACQNIGQWLPQRGTMRHAREADISVNLAQDSYLSGCRSRVNSAIFSGRRPRSLRAVSEAPTHSKIAVTFHLLGRFRYSTKASRYRSGRPPRRAFQANSRLVQSPPLQIALPFSSEIT
jgi:hypothetical protein